MSHDPIIDPRLDCSARFLMRIKRPDGSEGLVWVPCEHFDRVEALTKGEFHDASILGLQRA